MNIQKILNFNSVLIIFIFACALLFPVSVFAFETENVSNEEEVEIINENLKEEKEEEPKEEESIEKEEPVSETKSVNEETKKNNVSTNLEEHKVAVITTKVDNDGNPLKGATLQILDMNGNVVDEWVSSGESHTSMLPEGSYILHEKKAPEGYALAEDKEFTVKVEVFDMDAGVDFSEAPCDHYGGTPLYYVESRGEKFEVYCINQDWETPDDNSKYDGSVLSPSDIRNYTKQTVYTDAHQNKGLVDVSDQSLSSQELYDKILDIIYHRQLASSIFSDLTEAEIRYVTESALKNYTNAGLTRVQRVAKNSAPTNYENTDYYITSDGRWMWYLYPWYRSFVYDPTRPLGSDIFVTDIGNGDAFGTLARHWSSAHDGKNSEEVRQKIARYYELYLYLIGDSDPHPSDMHIYIYSTNDRAIDLSGYNFDDGAYQNLLGIRWFNPYDEDYKIELTLVNEPVKDTKKTKKKVYKKYDNPKTSDNVMMYFVMFTMSFSGLTGGSIYLRVSRKEYE